MSRDHLYFEFTNATEGHAAELNDWYDIVHIQECLKKIPGCKSGQRYKLNAEQRKGELAGRPALWEYVAVYELETDDVARASHLKPLAGSDVAGFTPNTDSLADDHATWIYTVMGPRVTEQDVRCEPKPDLGTDNHLFLAFANAMPGREDDFNKWYDDPHLPEVIQYYPGLIAGQRFIANANQQVDIDLPWKYLVLYDLRADDVAEYHRLDAKVKSEGRLISDEGAFDPDNAIWIYTPIGPKVVR